MISLLAITVSMSVVPTLIARSSLQAATFNGDSLNYFPLDIGNTWTYGFALDTTARSEATIFDTTRISGKLYHLYEGSALGMIGMVSLSVDTLCLDSVGRIWRYEGGQGYMLFDFSVDSGGTYPSYTTWPGPTTVNVKKNIEASVPAGRFSKCVDLFFRRSFGDEQVGYVFAPGVGIVQWYGPFIGTYVLIGAIINGKVISSVTQFSTKVPSGFSLEQNYPNPYNPTTTLKYSLPASSRIKLNIYNLLGQLVQTIVDGMESAGYKSVEWNANNLASGIYFYRLSATSTSDPSKSFTQVKKMLLIK